MLTSPIDMNRKIEKDARSIEKTCAHENVVVYLRISMHSDCVLCKKYPPKIITIARSGYFNFEIH